MNRKNAIKIVEARIVELEDFIKRKKLGRWTRYDRIFEETLETNRLILDLLTGKRIASPDEIRQTRFVQVLNV